nr:hypothetical protein Iba_chr08aCG10040 [Ipomoea batatas]
MSGSDNQNVSGRDYDEGVAEDDNQLRTSTLTEDASTSGQEKSAQVVLSGLFPQFSPITVEHIASTLPRGGLLASGETSYSAPPFVDADQ